MNEDREKQIRQIIAYQKKLKSLSEQVNQSRDDYTKLSQENQVLETYIENLRKQKEFSQSQQQAKSQSKSPKTNRKTFGLFGL